MQFEEGFLLTRLWECIDHGGEGRGQEYEEAEGDEFPFSSFCSLRLKVHEMMLITFGGGGFPPHLNTEMLS